MTSLLYTFTFQNILIQFGMRVSYIIVEYIVEYLELCWNGSTPTLPIEHKEYE